MRSTRHLLFPTSFPVLQRRGLDTLQVNLGYRCNQSCVHCHVNAGPTRREMMSRETAAQVLDLLRAQQVASLDLTGGAPELNPNFRDLVARAVEMGVHVIDRCNLTVLQEPGQEDTAGFLADHGVEVVASLPCYLEDNVDSQRGKGVFETSIRVLRQLNVLGYGQPDGRLTVNLVYNPQGPDLPPPEERLEADYKRHLSECYGVVFNHLFALTNMPILRFGSVLAAKGRFDAYLDLLRSAHQQANLETVMCRDLVSVDWRGYVYDCDFNQMLDLPLSSDGNAKRLHITDLIGRDLGGLPIRVAEHCYGCTAGQGSSCGGALGA